jgi:cyanate permease
MAEFRRNSQRPLALCGLWLVVGFSGASALAAGLLRWLDGEIQWRPALASAALGGMLATVGWQRSRSVLAKATRVSAVADEDPRDHAWRALQAYCSRRASRVARYRNTTGPEAQ